MFAYCRNNPVKRKDASGTEDLCVTSNEDDSNPLNDYGPVRGGGGGAGGNSSLYGRSSSFRSNLQKSTGKNGTGQHAHHVYPVSFSDPFNNLGINVNDPQNGAWWDAQSHLENSYAYNQWWKAFFSIDNITSADAKALAEFLAQLFGFVWNS